MKKNQIQFFEIIVFIAIILVLFQTFFEDFASLMGWPKIYREGLIWAGFIFDLFFTIEFLTRLYWAFIEKRVGKYFFHERGWIDLAASIPLLMLNSGPSAFALVSAASTVVVISGILNVLKVLKVVRIARVLRFLRVMKLFKNIKYTNSKMAQRHLMRITTLIITTVVLVIFSFSIVQNITVNSEISETASEAVWKNILRVNKSASSISNAQQLLKHYAQNEPLVWTIEDKTGRLIYAEMTYLVNQNQLVPGDDYIRYDAGKLGIKAIINRRPVLIQESLQNLLFFALVVILVAVLVFLYSPHFALTVTDPILIMKNGMKDPHYNLEIRIPLLYKNDEVYELAEEYNEVFLPLKDRDLSSGKGEKDGSGLSLKLEDIDFLTEENDQV